MVIGENFVIGHPGKTGGDAILHLCRLLDPRHALIVDSVEDGRKHHYFHRRQCEEPELGLDNKVRLLSFRRLETWLASYHAHFQRQFGLGIDRGKYAQGLIPFFSLNSERTRWSYEPGDALLREYLDKPVSGFIRMEFMKPDLLRLLSLYLPLSKGEIQSIKRDRYFKKSPAVTDWNPRLTEAELGTIRRNNPLWSELEREIYTESEE